MGDIQTYDYVQVITTGHIGFLPRLGYNDIVVILKKKEHKYMKRNLAILSAVTVILSQSAFGTTQNYGTQSYGTMKCISNPIEPKDFKISYADSKSIVTYSNGTFTVNNGSSAKRYTVPGIKDWNTPAQLSSDRYRLTRTYDKTSKIYNYSSLDILTGNQNFLIKTKSPIDTDYFKLLNDGKLLISGKNELDSDSRFKGVNSIRGLVANSTIEKSMTNLKFANFVEQTKSLYYWKDKDLNLIDLSSFKEYSIFKKVANKSDLIFTGELVFLKNGDTLKGFSSREKSNFDITGIKNISRIEENSQQTKLAIITDDNKLIVYNIKTRSIEKTINIHDFSSDTMVIFWNHDGSTPLLLANFITQGRNYCDLSLVIKDQPVIMCSDTCDILNISKDSFSYLYGTMDEGLDGPITETRSISSGKLIKQVQGSFDPTNNGAILRKEKDFTLTYYKGYPYIESPTDLTSACTQDKQYYYISYPNKKGFYIYNFKTNKLYRTEYHITNIISLYVIQNKYVIILASDINDNKYLNTFVLN